MDNYRHHTGSSCLPVDYCEAFSNRVYRGSPQGYCDLLLSGVCDLPFSTSRGHHISAIPHIASARQQHLPVRALHGERCYRTPANAAAADTGNCCRQQQSFASEGYHTPLLSHPLITTPPFKCAGVISHPLFYHPRATCSVIASSGLSPPFRGPGGPQR